MSPIPQSPIDYEAAKERLREQAKKGKYDDAYMLGYKANARIEVPEVFRGDG